jgi:bifunctional non-homologous end joining protein LigD
VLVNELFDCLSEAARAALRACAQPEWFEPMLATLTDERFSDPDWIFERKLDGVRTLAFCKRKGEVRLFSRNRHESSATWPELVERLERERCHDFVVDGEVVAFEGKRTRFEKLQARIGIEDPDEARDVGVAVELYLFDVLYVNGHDTTQLPLRERKKLLRSAFSFGSSLHVTPHRNRDGEAYFEAACAKRWEGLIAKDATATYVPGRSRKWLEFKCSHGQELVIGGYTDPKGSREHFGALLVGYYEGTSLRYAGKVGTGFDQQTLAKLGAAMRRRERKTSPFEDEVDEPDAHFVRPELVGEVGFTEWTRDGKLRHPRFLGLRRDKAAEDVRREQPEARHG